MEEGKSKMDFMHQLITLSDHRDASFGQAFGLLIKDMCGIFFKPNRLAAYITNSLSNSSSSPPERFSSFNDIPLTFSTISKSLSFDPY